MRNLDINFALDLQYLNYYTVGYFCNDEQLVDVFDL